MISKELLSEVLDRPIIKIQKAGNTLLAYWDIYSAQHSLINIYELAHKCKEWCKNTHTILSAIQTNGTGYVEVRNYSQEHFYADSELEAIFLACQWMLDEKEN